MIENVYNIHTACPRVNGYSENIGMRPLTALEIFGTWATCLLHIASDDSICFSSLEADVAYLIEAGVNGIYTNGTAGEFTEQSESEFDRISETVAGLCHYAGMNFQLGAGFPTAAVMLDRVRRAARLKPGAIQFIFPDWFPLNDAERLNFLLRTAEAADGISLVLYNPPHAKRVLTPEEIGALRIAVPTLVGVKTGIGDSSVMGRYRQNCEGMSVFIPGHHLATGIASGCSGSYSNVACLDPQGAQRWFDLCLKDINAALRLEVRIQLFFAENITPFMADHQFCNAAIDKFLASVGGWSRTTTRMRAPYLGIETGDVAACRRSATQAIPEVMVHLASIGLTNFST